MTPHELADAYVDFRKQVDLHHALWAGQLDYLESWSDPSHHATQAVAERYTEFRDTALVMAEEASPRDRELLRTIAATAQLGAVWADLEYDLEFPNPNVGLIGLLVPFLPRYPLVTRDHGERYLAKLKAFPAFAEGMARRAENAAERGIVPLRSHAERTVSMLGAKIDDPSHFYGQPEPTEGFDGWDAALRAAVDGPFVEGLRTLRAAFIEDFIPNGHGDEQPGLCHLPNGPEMYDQLVKAHTTLDLSADEVHHLGLQQVERLAGEYREIAGPIFGTDDVGEILDRLRSDPELHYDDADTLIADALDALDRANAEAPNWFNRTPDAGCDGVAIEGGALAFYSDPPEGTDGNGTFFFNTTDPSAWTTFGLEAIAYHESVPGHHFQIAGAIEDPELHHVQQRMYIAAFNEGWGLYSERLSDEMGLYTSDLARIGMLQADSMRACRLVVDTGLHALGWTRRQAIDYMVQNSPMNEAEVAAEVDRYIASPGQALGYMIGRLAIDKARARAEEALGDRFDIKGFHDALLGAGTVSLPVMKERVSDWVASVG